MLQRSVCYRGKYVTEIHIEGPNIRNKSISTGGVRVEANLPGTSTITTQFVMQMANKKIFFTLKMKVKVDAGQRLQ